MPKILSDEELKEVVDAYDAYNGNTTAAASYLGIARTTFQSRYEVAVARNFTGEAYGPVTPPTHVLGKITQHYVDPVTKKQEWRRLVPKKEQLEELFEDFAARLNAEIVPLPQFAIDMGWIVHSGLTIYPVPDFHFGQLSWGKETGENWDMNIAKDTILGIIKRLLLRTVATLHAWVIFLGDYFHADDETNMTKKSHNTLDVDGRNSKVTHMGAEIAVTIVDLVAQKHHHVHVVALPGNHDPKSGGDLLTLALWMRYSNNERITIERRPGFFFFKQFGNTMIGAHHGHTVKPENMPATMAAYEPEMWGATKFRYAYCGHFHRRIRGRDQDSAGGAIWEVFQAITARDAWNRSMGHSGGRSMVAITISEDGGEQHRDYEPI